MFALNVAPKKKSVKEGKDIKGKTSTTKVKRRKRKVRRTRLRKKKVCCMHNENNQTFKGDLCLY